MAGLSTSDGSGTQTTTQSPQASVGSAAGTAAAGSVQPGTATSLLTSSSGVALHGTNVTTVSLANSTGTTTTAAPTPAAPSRHINVGLGAVSLLLCLVGAWLLWLTFRGAKTTTE